VQLDFIFADWVGVVYGPQIYGFCTAGVHECLSAWTLAGNGNQLFREPACYSAVDIRRREEPWADRAHDDAWLYGVQKSSELLRVADIAVVIDCPRDRTVRGDLGLDRRHNSREGVVSQ
jgi:hypothetical protein